MAPKSRESSMGASTRGNDDSSSALPSSLARYVGQFYEGHLGPKPTLERPKHFTWAPDMGTNLSFHMQQPYGHTKGT